MKMLDKLNINPEKVIQNEELVNLRGGYPGCYSCDVTACSGCSTSYGLIACVGVTQEIVDYVDSYWPDATYYSCMYQPE